MQQIGIGITVHNRHETASKTIEKIRKQAPKGSKIIIVDDASNVPFPNSDFRFDKNVGIAAAKNKCFELLDDCEHIFLFDDDCWPKVKDWHLPYVNSGHNHLMYIFDKLSSGAPNGNKKIKELSNVVIYENPCGCMMYYRKECINAVGGMDTGYGRWGFEHPDHSTRIFNAGLTPFKFMDIKGSDELFYSHDKEQTIERSVPSIVRLQHIARNRKKYERIGDSKHFIPYKKGKNLILTCYFTSLVDPQRGEKWDFDKAVLNALFQSIPDDADCITLCDVDCGHYEYTEPKHANPYLAKWIAFYDYILANNQYDNIFMVDGTDVEVLNSPFHHIEKGIIYAGDENGTIGSCVWLRKHHNNQVLRRFYLAFGRHKLYNAGILGGDRLTVIEFLKIMVDYISTIDTGLTDMAIFNMTLHKHFQKRVVSGRKVNTVFKAFNNENKEGSWFKHK